MNHLYEVNCNWIGGLSGNGMLKSTGLESVFSAPVDLKGSGIGTSPEELLGLTASGCYAITLSTILSFQGITVKECKVKTQIEVVFDKGLELKRITHFPKVVTSNGTVEKIKEAVLRAKTNCFISKALNERVVVEVNPEIIVEEAFPQ